MRAPILTSISELFGRQVSGAEDPRRAKLVNLLSMSDKQFQDWLDLQTEFRELLKSVTTSQVEVSTRQHKTK